MINSSFKILSAFLAFCLWGSWAYFINHNIKSALVQGAASFVITLILIKFVTYLFNILPQSRVKFFLPTFITISLTSSFLIVIHSLAKTQNILFTILPPIIVASIFCFVVTIKLEKNTNDKLK